jgi:hypothetical protein
VAREADAGAGGRHILCGFGLAPSRGGAGAGEGWRGGTSDRFGRGLPELVRFLGQLEGGEADRRSRGGDSSTKAEVARIMWAAVQLPAEEAAGGDARG